jgi:EAL domain-containing protein (putative c-di-GMP-specific phosphodiesterase class I)
MQGARDAARRPKKVTPAALAAPYRRTEMRDMRFISGERMMTTRAAAKEGESAARRRRDRRGDSQAVDFIETWCPPRGLRAGAAALITAVWLATAGTLTLLAGGTQFVFLHLFYIPVLLAAFFFGPLGGAAIGIVAGLVAGPLMPLDAAAGLAQSPANWGGRLVFFAAIGMLAGLVRDLLVGQIAAVRRFGYYEHATGLPNRALFAKDLDAAMHALTLSAPLAVVAVDVFHPDRYSDLLATLGHQRLDRLVRRVGAVLEAALPLRRRLYYLGMARFALVLPEADEGDALAQCRVVARALAAPLPVDGVPLLAEATMGVAPLLRRDEDAMALLRKALAAAHDARRGHKPWLVFRDEAGGERGAAFELLRDLDAALKSGRGLKLHFQPLVELKTGRCAGAEALLRWRHPQRGAIPPGAFLAEAEQTALNGPLTEWVVRQALGALAEWRRGGAELALAINVAGRSLRDPAFADRLARLVAEAGLEAGALTVEVSERAFAGDAEAVAAAIAALREHGLRVAIDDFGTGQNSLALLKTLPVDAIKLDPVFVRSLTNDPRGQAIVRATIDLARQLGAAVVAEGVETRGVRDMLRLWSCDLAQGALFAPPLAAGAFKAWLAGREAEPHLPAPAAARR